MKIGRNNILILAVALTALLASCSAGKDNTGRIFMPDMAFSHAYETYSENKVSGGFENMINPNASARIPDQRSIPYGYLPESIEDRNNEAYMKAYMSKNYYANWNFDPDNYQAHLDKASAEIQNPLEYTDWNLAEGKKLYDIQCAVCHGAKGAGDGSIIIEKDDKGNEIGDGPYKAIPPHYKDRLPGMTDGHMFYSVTYGKNQMGGYAHALNVEERWQVIMYIKKLAGLDGVGTPPAPMDDMEEEMEMEEAAEEVLDVAVNN